MTKVKTRHRVVLSLSNRKCACLALAAGVSTGPVLQAGSIDFEALDPGRQFGSVVDQERNEMVLSSDGIAMFVDALYFSEQFSVFGYAEVGGRHADSLATNALELNNITVMFDFANVEPDVDLVTLQYFDFGVGEAINNFAVNGRPVHIIGSMMSIPANIAADVTATVTGTASAGRITLEGSVDSLRIGGQELYIDNIVAVPEPGALVLLAVAGAGLARRRKKPPVTAWGDA